jgi:hypothetical protein
MVCYVKGILAKAKKMVATMPKNKIYMKSMRKMNIHKKRFIFFLLWGRWVRLELFYSCVFNLFVMMFLKFATCSQNISLYPIFFAQSSTLLTNINKPKGDTLSSHRHCSFGEPPNLRFYTFVVG